MGAFLVKRALIIAYHFPPFRGGSGIHRTLKFTRYLRDFGWEPIVLSVAPRAYPRVGEHQLREIPEETVVKRSFAVDVTRHLTVRGRSPRFLALPDRWGSWWFSAVPAGLGMIRKHRPMVMMSTYPIATAHLIGLTLKRLTGLPWVADFRDSMTEEGYPSGALLRQTTLWIERQTVRRCERAVFTTPGTLEMYSARYPELPSSRWSVIANGYDEAEFAKAENRTGGQTRREGPVVLLHSGVLYSSERDPRSFYWALGELRRRGKIGADSLRVVLRASGNEKYHKKLIDAQNIGDIVDLAPAVPYSSALEEMLEADGLLLFQGSSCNHQIPAKLYEYLRARRPVLALTDPCGDTAGALLEAGIDTIVPLDAREAVLGGLQKFLDQVREGDAPVAAEQVIRSHTRQQRTARLAKVFDEVTFGGEVREHVKSDAKAVSRLDEGDSRTQ